MIERTDEDYAHVDPEVIARWARNLSNDILKRLSEQGVPPLVGIMIGGAIWAEYAVRRGLDGDDAVRDLTQVYENARRRIVFQ